MIFLPVCLSLIGPASYRDSDPSRGDVEAEKFQADDDKIQDAIAEDERHKKTKQTNEPYMADVEVM